MADFYKILEKFSEIEESGLTPVGVKKGLNPQQKSVGQMPATAKVASQGPILGAEPKQHPASKWLVGSMEEDTNNEKLSKVSTEKLQAFWNKHKDEPGIGSAFGQQLRAVSRELARRRNQGVAEGLEDSNTQDAIIDTVKRLFYKNKLDDYGALEAIRQGVKHHFSKPGATVESAINGILSILDKRMRKSGNYLDLSKFKESLRQGVAHQLKKQGMAEDDASHNGINPDTMQILEGHGNSPVARAIANRIIRLHPEMITDYGIEHLMNAINDEAERIGDVEEIGSSDVSAWIQNIKRDLDGRLTADLREGVATEDVLSTVKKKLGDYLKNIEDEIKSDPDLKDKLDKDVDVVGPAVKTITTDDGHEIKIHGNEDDGFRITIQNKPAKTSFKDLDEASMAVEMFNARRRRAAIPEPRVEIEVEPPVKVAPRAALLQRLKQDQDYVDEK